MPELRNPEATIHFEFAGEGQTLVLIPGFASGAWSWKYQLPDFSSRFRVLTFDPRGIGRSSIRDGAAASIGDIANDILGILDREGIELAHVLGISFGGFVAQHLAISRPERVNRLVLASTSAGGPTHVAPEPAVLAALASHSNSTDRDRRQLSLAFTPEFAEASTDVVDDFCSLRESNHVGPNVLADQIAAAVGFDVRGSLDRILAPTLVLTGDRDAIVPAANSAILAERVPRSRLKVIAGAGHMFFVESPTVFNTAVIDFLLE